MAKKIIVIGSGFGGLAASLRLKAKGYDVTLVEKHPDLGGRARVFKKDNFVYDGGPTVITAPYLFDELFLLKSFISFSRFLIKIFIISISFKELISLSLINFIESAFIRMDLLILLPSDSLIPLQLVKESEISL